jgi:ACT domain-containing protein
MALSDFEIGKIAEIVAGKVGTRLDAKQLRQVIDGVVDSLKAQQGNPEITGVTCEVSSRPASAPREGKSAAMPPMPPPDEAMVSASPGLYERIEKTDHKRVIIAAFGKDRPGIVAAIANTLAENSCSIEDISQTLMQEFFSMIMVVDISSCPIDLTALTEKIKATEQRLGMKVYMMHEDIFQFMHRI